MKKMNLQMATEQTKMLSSCTLLNQQGIPCAGCKQEISYQVSHWVDSKISEGQPSLGLAQKECGQWFQLPVASNNLNKYKQGEAGQGRTCHKSLPEMSKCWHIFKKCDGIC